MSNAKAALNLRAGSAKGLRIAAVVGQFNAEYTSRLLKSARARLKQLGLKGVALSVYEVPGVFELGLACKEAAATNSFDAVIAIGAVLRGDTSHYDLVCDAATQGVLRAGMDTGVPVIFGVITVENAAQALERCSGGDKDAGRHAAEAAVHMAGLLRRIRHGR